MGFASRISEAIETRLGLHSNGARFPTPFADAPLFDSELSLRHVCANDSADNVLPPRKQADRLVGLYWQHLDPIEPVLHHTRFCNSYKLLLDGGELDCDERIFVCTLNAIFALSTQWQESIASAQRTETSKVFFQRSWSLLHLEKTAWESSRTETVQCLILIARYLQCTPNLQATWMAIGVAVRMAQGLALHRIAEGTYSPSGVDAQTARKVWQCCVSMDRYSDAWFPGTALIQTKSG